MSNSRYDVLDTETITTDETVTVSRFPVTHRFPIEQITFAVVTVLAWGLALGMVLGVLTLLTGASGGVVGSAASLLVVFAVVGVAPTLVEWVVDTVAGL